jgi:hypothetical protein
VNEKQILTFYFFYLMENFLTNIAKANENVANIENQLFDVEMKPLIVADTNFSVVDWYGVFKSTGGNQLGIVGNRFLPTQPRAVFQAFCDAILDYGLDTAKMRYTEVKGGEVVRFSIDLEPISYINLRKQEDTTIPTLNLQIGLNGKVTTSMFLSTLRLICTNGAKKSFTEFATSFKNVKGNQGKIVGMFDDVVRCMEEVTDVKELYARMNKVTINQDVVNTYLKRVADIDMAKYNEYAKQKQNSIDAMNKSIELEISRTGANLFGLYNGLTHYANHEINTKDKDSVFSGVGSKLIARAEKVMLELV